MKRKTKQLLAVIAIGLIVVACTLSSSENKPGRDNPSPTDTTAADTTNQALPDTAHIQ
jgi:hypothetical protein